MIKRRYLSAVLEMKNWEQCGSEIYRKYKVRLGDDKFKNAALECVKKKSFGFTTAQNH